MSIPLERKRWRPEGGFKPTSPYTGDGNYIFAGVNMIVKGNNERLYVENWRAPLNLNESVPATILTGSFATTADDDTVTGTSTLFTEQLILSEQFLIGNRLYSVLEIISNTSMRVTPTPDVTISGQTGKVLHIIIDVDNQRGTLARGGIQRFPKGHLLVAGQGEVRLDGVALTPTSLTASKRLQIAVFNPTDSSYAIFPLGMATPVLTTVAGVAGGTKGMEAGTYSIRITPARTATDGENNPSNKVEVTITAGQKIRITFPAMDTASGQDAWGIYGTLFSTGGGIQGPWFLVKTISTSAVAAAGGTYDIEWLDAEITENKILEFDNDAPPDAGFVVSLQGIPVLVSCNGPGRVLQGTAATTAGSATVAGTSTQWVTDMARGQSIYIDGKLYTVTLVTSNTSIAVDPAPLANASGKTVMLGDTTPGPVIRPAKFDNIEAFSSDFKVAVSPPENIIGVREANGRLFLMTRNRLHMATLTGNPELPVTVRPFWKAGFRNSEALVVVNGNVYGFTTNGATRSLDAGDEIIEEHQFAADVASIMKEWQPENVRLGYDPVNEAICFFCANQITDGNFFQTQVLMYMLRLGVWSPPDEINLVITELADATVSGVATVGGKLYMVINEGNREWDASDEELFPAPYIATPFLDFGIPEYDKTLHGVACVFHSSTDTTTQVYAVRADEDIPIDNLLNNAPSGPNGSGTFGFDFGAGPKVSRYQKLNVKQARLLAFRQMMPFVGNGAELSRLDELVWDVSARKNRY